MYDSKRVITAELDSIQHRTGSLGKFQGEVSCQMERVRVCNLIVRSSPDALERREFDSLPSLFVRHPDPRTRETHCHTKFM